MMATVVQLRVSADATRDLIIAALHQAAHVWRTDAENPRLGTDARTHLRTDAQRADDLARQIIAERNQQR